MTYHFVSLLSALPLYPLDLPIAQSKQLQLISEAFTPLMTIVRRKRLSYGEVTLNNVVRQHINQHTVDQLSCMVLTLAIPKLQAALVIDGVMYITAAWVSACA